MVLKKKILAADGGEIDSSESGVVTVQTKSNGPAADHWDFLDEIEAPRWVDLTLECKSAYEDKDDDWFKISHQFHQCSSQRLRSAFSGLDEGCIKMDLGIAAPSSPKIPSSISKTRGKSFKHGELGKEKHKANINKRHPVKNLSIEESWVNFGSDKTSKDKSCCKSAKENPGLDPYAEGKHTSSDPANVTCLPSASSCGDMTNHTNPSVARIVDSNSTIFNTSEGTRLEQQKTLDVPSQVPSSTSEFLSTLRVTLRRSCATRQAARVEVKRGRQSQDRKSSSSSKSSVGSSSNPGSDKDVVAMVIKNKTPQSHFFSISNCSNEKQHIENVSNEPSGDSDRKSKNLTTLQNKNGISKVEVRHRNPCSKVLASQRVNEQKIKIAVAKTKQLKGASCSSRSVRDDKENLAVVNKSYSRHNYPTAATKIKERSRARNCIEGEHKGRTALSQISCTQGKGTKGSIQAQKTSKWLGQQRCGTEGLVALQARIRGRTGQRVSAKVFHP